MIPLLAPHHAPVQTPQEPVAPGTQTGESFDDFLPGQPPPDPAVVPEGDAPPAPGMIATGPMLTLPPVRLTSSDVKTGVASDHFLPETPSTDSTAFPDDAPAAPGMIATGPALPPGRRVPEVGGALVVNPGLITTGSVLPPAAKAGANDDDSVPLPTFTTTGPTRLQPGNATPGSDDSPGAPGAIKTGPMRLFRPKDTRRVTADAAAQDAAAMAAQMPTLVDLRSVVPAVTLTVSLALPVSAPSSDAGPLDGGDGTPNAAVAGSPASGSMKNANVSAPGGTVPRAAHPGFVDWPTLPTPGGDLSSTPENEPTANAAQRTDSPVPPAPNGETLPGLASVSMVSAAPTMQSLPPVVQNVTDPSSTPASISTAPGTAQDAPPAGAEESTFAPAVTDSRLAAPAPAVEPQVTISGSGSDGWAKIAGRGPVNPRPVQPTKRAETQAVETENFKPKEPMDGTPVAKRVSVVNATLTSHEMTAEDDVPPRRDASTVSGALAPRRAGVSQTRDSEVLINTAITGAASVDAATTRVAVTTAPAESTSTRQAMKVETLLQNALSVGESVRPDGHGQMEMRVRLGGGTEDVTVRMQVTNDHLQVTFQTNSPELRKALEHGWQQFSATAAQTSTLSLDRPRFETSRFDAVPGGQGDNASFSSNQQNARRQEAESAFADDSAPATPPRTSHFDTTATASAAGQSAGRRWNGWA